MAAETSASDALGAPAGGRLRLRTLVLIRWVAVIGQAAAVTVVHVSLGFEMPLAPAMLLILASAGVNLHAHFTRSSRQWLHNREAMIYLGYDLIQLCLLLALTGGLANPFSLLILAPLAVSASFLSRSSTFALSLLAVLAASLLAFFHLPLPWPGGGLDLPAVYIAGIWTALVLAIVFVPGSVASAAEEGRRLSDALSATQMALAREQRLSALGGLAAAAAHELGSPLGTITVVAKDLARELPEDSPHKEDAELLLSESARCRDILARLAARPEGLGVTPFDRLPLPALVEAAAAPYRVEAVSLTVHERPAQGAGVPPKAPSSPEMLHGLGTLVQNAVQFAESSVEIEVFWNADQARVTIRDDGPGFDPEILPHLGEPYVSTRSRPARQTVEGDHMGLGVFIAQTLLGHSAASLDFRNRRGTGGGIEGAEVVISWPRATLESLKSASKSPNGKDTHVE